MDSKYTRLFAVFAVALMVLSAALPLVSYDSSAETPAKYTIQDQYLTPVRNQSTETICWAFGVTAALETEMIRQGYATNQQFALSPLYLDLKQYDGYEKDYRGGDFNSLYNEGKINTTGGSSISIFEIFSNWLGPVEEYLAPYDEFFVDYYSVDRSLGSSILVKGIQDYNPLTQVNEIKQQILDNHGAVFFYSAEGRQTDTDTGRFTFFAPYIEGPRSSHAVQLIGWDDDYSKDKFLSVYGTKPSNNGAWLIKNSWGTGDITSKGDGYAWVSYESFVGDVLFFTDIEKNDGNQHLYSYDHGYSYGSDLYRSGSATMANIFTCERNEKLTGVSMTYLGSSFGSQPDVFDQSYVVKVYKLRDGYKNPTEGDLVYTSDKGVANYCGLVNVKFNKAIELTQGEKFSVCIELTGSNICLPVDTCEDLPSLGFCHTVAEAGQSYYLSANGNWTDISADCKSNFRIKAYTTSEPSGKVASITRDDQTTYYNTLQEAVNDAKKDEVIMLLCSVEMTDTLKIENKDFFVIDLSGFTVSVAGKDVVSVMNSSVWFTQGKLKCTDGKGSAIVTDNSVTDLSRVYLDSVKNCVTAKNGSTINTHYCTFNNNNAYSLVYMLDASSNVNVERQYLTKAGSDFKLCELGADGKLTLNEGEFYGSIVGGFKPIVCAGKFYVKDAARFALYTGSSSYDIIKEGTESIRHVGINCLKYQVSDNDWKPMFNLAYAYNLSIAEGRTSCVIQLTSDYFTWGTDNLYNAAAPANTIPVSIDLNGHKMTSMSNLFGLYNKLTLTNSSYTRSTIECASFGFVGKLTIEHNIDVITTRYLSSMAIDGMADINISNLSNFYHKNDRGISLEIYVPYSKDGHYCETVTTVKYEDDRSTIKAKTVEERTYSKLDRPYESSFTYTSATTYADGSTETTVDDGSGTTITIKKDGTKNYTGTISGVSFNLTEGGEGAIYANIPVGFGQEITIDNVKSLVDALNSVKDSDKVKEVGCKEIKLTLLLNSTSGFEHSITKDAVELLANNNFDLTTRYQSVIVNISSDVLMSIHGKLTYEYAPMNGSNTSESITKVVDGKKIAYTLTMKVDGKKIGKLSGDVSFTAPILRDGMKPYLVSEDGKFTEIEIIPTPSSTDTISFKTNTTGTFVLCDGLDPDDEESKSTDSGPIDGVLIAAIVIAAIVGCGFVFLIFRPRH